MDIRRDTESNVTGNFHLAKTHPYTSSGKDVQCDSHYGEKDFNTHVATTEIEGLLLSTSINICIFHIISCLFRIYS